MPVTLIVTTLNEASSVTELWQSILVQTQLPNEVIVVDGGSTDATVVLLQNLAKKTRGFNAKILVKSGNRSVGRNWAIQQATHNLIACTDAGCVLKPDWLEQLLKVQNQTQADVVAGYYAGLAKTSWQAAVIPYALVMPDQLPQPPAQFLPATRSLLLTRAAWQKAGQFNENLSDNEDYALAHALIKTGAKLAFAKTAIVFWHPPQTWLATAKMFYRFARGDAAAGLWRPKVGLIFLRYLIWLGLGFDWLWLVFITDSRVNAGAGVDVSVGGNVNGNTSVLSFYLGWILGLSVLSYLGWAISKNVRYCRRSESWDWSWGWLPLLQVTADWAVMTGTLAGIKQRVMSHSPTQKI